MSIELQWLVEEQVLHVIFPEVLTADMMRDYDAQLLRQLESASGKLHFIADITHVKTLPPLNVLVSLRHPHHPHLGHGLTLGLTRNPLARFLIAMGTQIAGVHHRDFETFDEARSYLHQMEQI